MDDMDIDQVVAVPDTPDRVAVQNINGRDFIRRKNYSSISNYSESSEFSDEALKNQLRSKNKLATETGSQRLLVRPRNDLCNSDNSESHRTSKISALGNAASSRNALTLKRSAVDKTINHKDSSEFSEEGFKNQLRNKNKLVTDRGSQRLLVRPRNDLYNSDNSESDMNFKFSALGNAASSRNALTLKRNAVDETIDHEDNSEFSEERFKNQLRNKNKLATDRGSQRLLVRPRNDDLCNSDKSESHMNFRISALGNAALSRNALTLNINEETIDHEDNSEFLEEGLKNQLRNKDKLATDRGSQRLLVRPRKDLCDSDNSESHGNFRISALGNAASSRAALTIQRIAVEETFDQEDKTCVHPQPTGKGKALSTSQSQMSACKGHDAVLDLSEQSGHSKVCPKFIPRNSRSKECREGTSVNSCPSIHFTENSPEEYNNAFRGKEKLVDTDNIRASLDRGKGIELVAESQPNSGRAIPTSLHLSTSHRISGQKRLVRNGCISPLNVEKAKQSAQKHISSFVNPEQNDSEIIRELIAEANDSHRVKGKGVLTSNFSSKESDAKTMSFSSRSSTLNGKDDGTSDTNEDAFECSGGLGGWRSTRNRTKKLNAPFSDEDVLVASRKDDPCKVNEPQRNGVVRRDYKNGSNARNCSYYPKDQQSVFSQDVSASPIVQTVSHFKHQVDQLNEHPHAANALIKKMKQGSTGSHQDKSSSSAFDNSELVILGSSGEPSNIRSTRTLNNHNAHSSNPVIEIDEFSPKIRSGGSHNVGCSGNVDSDVRARQLEADEILARELQEQLYNEVPGVGVREIDEHIALALQQEESSHASSSGSHHVSHPRGSLIPNFQRQTQSRSSQNQSRRGTRARVPTSTRMARLRGRFPGQPRTISSGQRNSLFHPNVDVDMRIHILEALEAFSDMGMAGGFLQTQRDFNENDYEMLLALDENNHQHGGATVAQINGLPQSTVQTDNLEECSICLETPSIGDNIRHLPCLHRFHKDCIDPWLSRRPSCPICKSSIT